MREQITKLVWGEQYDRFLRGEIDDPWNPANDGDDLRALRARLDALIRTQQGRGDAGAEAGTIVKDEFDQVYTKAGGSGMIGALAVTKAAPDGHTLLLGTAASHGINASLYKKLPFDVEADFTAVAPLVDVSNVLVINPSVIDAKDLKSFVDQVRAQPGKFNYASTGNGTGVHLAMAEFLARASLEMTHVPYKGGPEALQAVLKGEVCCIFNQVQTILPQLKSERIRLLAVSSAKRVSALAEIPTIAESGYPGYDSGIWFALFGPKQMDPSAVKAINDAVRQVLGQSAIRERFASRGNQVRIETSEQFRQTVRLNRQRWAEVVKASGASID